MESESGREWPTNVLAVGGMFICVTKQCLCIYVCMRTHISVHFACGLAGLLEWFVDLEFKIFLSGIRTWGLISQNNSWTIPHTGIVLHCMYKHAICFWGWQRCPFAEATANLQATNNTTVCYNLSTKETMLCIKFTVGKVN